MAERGLQSVENQNVQASAERIKAFTDAVVAIAMTLLILPLMDSVGELSKAGGTAWEWVSENRGQLFIFVLSFVLIAAFWMSHHRLFERIHRVSQALLILNIAWMFTIVWLPVATATFGLIPLDTTQKALYFGALFATSSIMAVIGVYLISHPELHTTPEDRLRRGVVAEVAAAAAFAIAFVVAAVSPAVGYWSMVLLVLIGPAQILLYRVIPGTRPATR